MRLVCWFSWLGMLQILISKRLIPSGAHLLLIDDCFTNSVNAKVPRFYSLFFSTWVFGCQCVSFWLGWGELLAGSSRTLNSSCSRTFCQLQVSWGLVVPFWPSSLFWPYLIQGNSAYKSFVVDFLFVQNGRDVFVHGANRLVWAPPHLVLPCCFWNWTVLRHHNSTGQGSCFTVVVPFLILLNTGNFFSFHRTT